MVGVLVRVVCVSVMDWSYGVLQFGKVRFCFQLVCAACIRHTKFSKEFKVCLLLKCGRGHNVARLCFG